MSQLSLSQAIALPAPRVPITIRPGVVGDISFIDQLQKKQSKQVGFFPTKALEGKIDAGHVLIAEARDGGRQSSAASASPASRSDALQVGYLIAQDQYFKRDDLGVIYQMNVVTEYRRHLVAATLLKAQFERSAYGCKLYCCWCAQDIEANRFWEAMGFVPLAYRAGGIARGRQRAARSEDGSLKADRCKLTARVHIFWQKRIRQGDTTTPWWFPSKTTGGALAAERIVLPIPPGMKWRDELPVLLPVESVAGRELSSGSEGNPIPPTSKRKPRTVVSPMPGRVAVRFGPPGMAFSPIGMPEPAAMIERTAPPMELSLETAKPRRAKAKHEPAVYAKARELRDRWMEHVSANENASCGVETRGAKYDVARIVETSASLETKRLAA